ncbi:MAG: FecR family protein [Acidobacteriota bacterium]|nr:FecR family protein [Acidobacteriota bacterium]
MRKAFLTQIAAVFILVSVVSLPSTSHAQNREKFVISAQAGGINAVTGRATMHGHGNSEWQQLTIKEDLEAGDVVRTGFDGRVEMLLNPGSYMRIGENSEFELADNSLENLEVRLVKGTAILEVTGADDSELLISITTPQTRMAIVRRGLYRVNVVPEDTTELIVRKGRVMLMGSHTKIKGGNKVVFSRNSFSVAKLEKADKKEQEPLEDWSKDRAKTLAQANSRLSGRMVNAFLSTVSEEFFGFTGRSGFWLYNPSIGGFTFLPFYFGWRSPYGSTYTSFGYGGAACCGRGYYPGPVFSGPTGPTGTSTGASAGGAGGSIINPPPTSVPARSMPDSQREMRESHRDRPRQPSPP